MGAGLPGVRGPAQFECEYCGRSFTTATGRGLHKRWAHPVEADAAIDLERKNERWSAEETRLMAREEAKALRTGGVRFMNQHLLTRFGGRTLESVKGKRKQAAYRSLVREFVAELSEPESDDPEDSSSAEEQPDIAASTENQEALREALVRFIGEADEAPREDEDQRLRECVERCLHNEGFAEPLLAWLTNTLSANYVWPPSTPRSGVGVRPTDAINQRLSRRDRRRREYASVQHLYKRDQKACADRVLGTGINPQNNVSPEAFRDFWSPLFSAPSYPSPAYPARSAETFDEQLWGPASIEEVRAARVSNTKAAGPDRLSPTDWNRVPDAYKQVMFNMFLYSGALPAELARTRTVFIAKKSDAAVPADFRPISMSSVICRHFHRLLASRMQRIPNLFSTRQRAFQLGVDGLADNLCVVQSVLREARQSHKTVHMVALDVSKAFDTVSRNAIVDVCGAVGMPRPFVSYIQRLYEADVTVLEVGGRCFPVPANRGVKQGDPLSPLLFNLVLDQALDRLDRDVGFDIGIERVTSLAFADDVMLFGTTVRGLQHNLEVLSTSLAEVGLSLNPNKCFAISLVASGRDHKIKTVLTPTYRVGADFIEQSGPLDLWRYLGVEFRGSGVSGCSLNALNLGLERLSKAPLKPQQRLHILRVYFLPRFYHAWVFGRVSVLSLRRIDQTIRKRVRLWLRLPGDVPSDFVHAPIRSGGLGIPQVARFLPLLRLRRLERAARSEVGFVRACALTGASVGQLQWCRERIPDLAALPDQQRNVSLQRGWAAGLHRSTDGAPLRESERCSSSTDWISNSSRSIPSRDWLKYHAVHINALPSRMRTTRGRREAGVDVTCRAGCRVPETPAHAIQSCHRTHGGRVMRHDAMAKCLTSFLRQGGWTVEQEVSFRTPVGVRRPDLIAMRGDRTVVVDLQVVAAFPSLDDHHFHKIAKYRDEAKLSPCVRKHWSRSADALIDYASLTISWRGVWSGASVRSLQALGLTTMQLRRLTTMALAGSHKNWVWFCASAVVRIGRGG